MIGITQAEAVLTIELQRPERRNALNSQLVEELTQAIRKAGDGSARAIVLTGQGTAFCAGADLSGDAFAADYPDRLIELHKAMDASRCQWSARSTVPPSAPACSLPCNATCGLSRPMPSSSFRRRNTVWPWITGASAGCRRWLGTDVPRDAAQRGKADRRDRTAHRNGESHWHFGRRPGLGRRDRQAGTTGYPARQAGAQRRRRYRGSVAGP